jgi:hypothetical protein
MEKNTKIATIGGSVIVTILVATFLFQYSVEPEYTTLYRNGSIMFRERWYVHAERTYFNLDSWYDENVKCPRVIEQGGRETETRCYYPDNFYESTARSLKNTDISTQPYKPNESVVLKEVPHYAYGTRGSYAGILTELSYFYDVVPKMEDIPYSYRVTWEPRDTRNYKLQWHITEVKGIDVPDGNYSECNYYFGDVKIDIIDCEKVDYVHIQDKTIDVYFKSQRGYQNITARVYDPIKIEYNEIDVVKEKQVYQKGRKICVKRLIQNPTKEDIVLSKETKIIKPEQQEYHERCFERENLLDPFPIKDAIDAAGLKSISIIEETVNGFVFNTSDEELIVK